MQNQRGRWPLGDYVTPREAAEMKGVSRRSVYKAIQAGRFPGAVRMSGYLHLIPRQEVQAWQTRRKQG